MTAGFTVPCPISLSHDISDFDCGEPTLNAWLRKRALANEASGASRTYVVCLDNGVVGYYCLSAGAVAHVDVAKGMRRNMPDPIPVFVLGRLAVDLSHQGKGLGRALLKDAIFRTLQVAEIGGIAGLLVHALSEDARRFYLSSGFVESPLQPTTLCLPVGTMLKL